MSDRRPRRRCFSRRLCGLLRLTDAARRDWPVSRRRELRQPIGARHSAAALRYSNTTTPPLSFNRHITEDGRSVTTKWRECKNFDYGIKRNQPPLRRETKLKRNRLLFTSISRLDLLYLLFIGPFIFSSMRGRYEFITGNMAREHAYGCVSRKRCGLFRKGFSMTLEQS